MRRLEKLRVNYVYDTPERSLAILRDIFGICLRLEMVEICSFITSELISTMLKRDGTDCSGMVEMDIWKELW